MKRIATFFLFVFSLWAQWELIDSVKIRTIIPEKGRVYIKFDDPIETLTVFLPYDSLTDLAKAAVRRSPSWLAPDLAENLRRLSREKQDLYANLILSSSHPFVDEISFQVAHISPHILSADNFYPQLLIENVTYLYRIDSLLDYVRIIDYGEPSSETAYYSTVLYRIVSERGDTMEILSPKEIYYWFILHPKISREICTYVDSLTGEPLPPPRGKFWRGYLFYHADPGYPPLSEYLLPVRTLWNSLRNDTANNGAIGAITNWLRRVMEFRPPQRRTYQPVQIYTQHHGTCTEWGILTPAVARAALIPSVQTRAYGNNHCWNEFYERSWHQWEPVNKMINDTTRYDPVWWNLAAGCNWRGDGFWWTVTERYTPYCTLTVRVFDRDSLPVDGARVVIAGGPQPVNWFCAFAYTDQNGEAQFTLGDTNSYDCAIESDLGNIPFTRIIERARANTHYQCEFNLSGMMPTLSILPDTFPQNPLNRYKVEISSQSQGEILFGMHPDDGSLFRERKGLGNFDFFISDSVNFSRYLQNEDFRALLFTKEINQLETSFVFPTEQPYYLVFANDERIGNGIDLSFSVKLYKALSGLREKKRNQRGKGTFLSPEEVHFGKEAKIYNPLGKMIKDKSQIPPGIYFIEEGNGRIKRIILCTRRKR
uniref:Transglutaminase domain-containing protein n=1 Tax=candidate division WOR-3 bacterium TaxID=2052148 RepID=A0A7C3UWV6_UNCW3